MHPSSSNRVLSREEVHNLVNALSQSGQLQEVMTEIYNAQASGHASMNDSSKRRMSADAPASEGFQLVDPPHFEEGPYKRQTPVMPTKKDPLSSESSEPLTLPDGVKSLEQWSTTVCTLPKVAHRPMSYDELVTASPYEEDLKSYLKYILTTKTKSAKVDDFRAYLHAIGYVDPDAGKPTYLGTSTVREFK